MGAFQKISLPTAVGGVGLLLATAVATAGEPSGTITRKAWSYDRASLLWDNDDVDLAKEKAANRVPATGWVEYEFSVPQTGWFELWFTGMSLDWARDILLDGKLFLRQSIAMPEDKPEGSDAAKEANLFLTAGKHTLRFRRMIGPGQFPSQWQLRPAAGRPEASLAIASIEDQIIPPGKEFKVTFLGGRPDKPLHVELATKSLIDGAVQPVGALDFPAGDQPTAKTLTIPAPKKGMFLLTGTADGQPLRPNDLKALPLVASDVDSKSMAEPSMSALSVGGPYGNGMVVQRDVKLPVWGFAKPGETVNVIFAGQMKSATADAATGRWDVLFDPISVGGPYKMEVTAGPAKLALNDILCGDVWLLGGQSNMGGRLREITNGKKAAETEATLPNVRLGWAAERGSPNGADARVATTWQAAAVGPNQTMDQLLAFNGIAFGLGVELHKKLNIPIGMVINNRGGTLLTTWTSNEAQNQLPIMHDSVKRWEEFSADNGVHTAAASNVPSLIRQTLTASTKPAADAAATKPIEPLTPEKLLAGVEERLRNKLDGLTRNIPSKQYTALTKPLAPFPFKGVVWYQGESDVNQAFAYGSMLKTMLTNWRETFGNPKLPFVVVQIAPGTGKPWSGPPQESRFGELQQTQESILSTPGTSIVTTYDLTTPIDDVHYRDKIPVGRRAALAALRNVYGMTDVIDSGPVYQSMKVDGNRVVLTFEHADGLKTKGDKLGGFSIAGEDRKFVWADAKIEGDHVVVSSAKVVKPVAVRYGWANSPCGANLYNTADLPARVFRTDSWPCVTEARTNALYGN